MLTDDAKLCMRCDRPADGKPVALCPECSRPADLRTRLSAIVDRLDRERLITTAEKHDLLEAMRAVTERAGAAVERERDRAAEERDGYKEASRRLRLTANTQERLLGRLRAERLRAERDCAVARAKDLEAALRLIVDDLGGEIDMSSGPVRGLQAIRDRINLVLHPPPPRASDRMGTEHHDAADPEDGCQAGARRP